MKLDITGAGRKLPPRKPAKGKKTVLPLKTALERANPLSILSNVSKFVAARTPKPADPFAGLAEALRAASASSASSDSAASALNAQLQREGLTEQRRQFNEDLVFRKSQQQFAEKDTMTQRLLESAGLATSATGAIQLAYMARGQGAPQAQIRSIFQNLPFVQALLQGKTLPGFGLPEQLGGATERVTSGAVAAGHAAKGKTFGVTLPTATGVTQQQFEGLTGQEQEFLGALHTAETGEGSEQFFQKMLKGFLPTTSSPAALAF